MNTQFNSNSTVKTADVLGKAVIDSQGEKLGKVDEIVLEKCSGQVRYAVIASGGFMGIGSDLHAVPWKALDYDVSEDSFKLNMHKANLQDAPGFNKDKWPDFSNEGYGKSLDDYYGPSYNNGRVSHLSSNLPQTTATPNPTKPNF